MRLKSSFELGNRQSTNPQTVTSSVYVKAFVHVFGPSMFASLAQTRPVRLSVTTLLEEMMSQSIVLCTGACRVAVGQCESGVGPGNPHIKSRSYSKICVIVCCVLCNLACLSNLSRRNVCRE